MSTSNHKKQTPPSHASSIASQKTTAGADASSDGANSDALLLSLAVAARELHGQSTGVVERLCQEIVEGSKGQVQLIVPGYRYRHTYMTSSSERPWLALPVEYGGRSYGKLEVAPHPTLSGQPALPYQQLRLLASNCALLLYSLETAAYFQREYPSPVKRAKDLTPREQEILSWLCRGYSRKQIAALLGIDTKTIAKMCGSLYEHLGVENERHAIAAAFTLGLSFPVEHLSPEINSSSAQQET